MPSLAMLERGSRRKMAPTRGRTRARLAGFAVAAWLAALAPPAAGEGIEVDLELVLAIDVSYSVDWHEGYLQREGYIRAFEDPRLIEAIQSGYLGRIAVTYVEWAGRGVIRRLVDWTLIDSPEAAEAFAMQLISQPVSGGRGTSISGILALSASMFGANEFDGPRWVIDISGDGANNVGGNVAIHRDMVVRNGITVNGLPILDPSGTRLPDLDVYYRECVIGGTGAFVVVADGFHSFAEAILRKMILEIAGRTPPGGIEWFGEPRLHRAQAVAPFAPYLGGPKYAPACNIGEIMRWQRQQQRLQAN